MGIRAVRTSSHDRPVIGRQPFRFEALQNEALDSRLSHRLACPQAVPDPLEHLCADPVHPPPRFQVTCKILLSPARFEELNQIRGTDNFDAQLPHQFDRSGIHQRNRRQTAFRRVLHRNPPRPGKQLTQPHSMLAPACVHDSSPREACEHFRFDAVH
jgi:hypothetical protein